MQSGDLSKERKTNVLGAHDKMLKYIVVGTGRDGTVSKTMFRALFPDFALVHLKRIDRAAAIASLVKNSGLFAETYLYYGATEGSMRRVAVFHENAMSREKWGALSLHDKFSWNYDYTHDTIEQEKRKYSRSLEITTETHSETDTLTKLSQFIAQRADVQAPESVHLNRHSYLHVDDFSEAARPYAQWLFGTLSIGEIARNTLYLSEYFSNKCIALTVYQITGCINEFPPAYAADEDESSHSLNRLEALLLQRLKEVSLLSADLAQKIGEDKA